MIRGMRLAAGISQHKAQEPKSDAANQGVNHVLLNLWPPVCCDGLRHRFNVHSRGGLGMEPMARSES